MIGQSGQFFLFLENGGQLFYDCVLVGGQGKHVKIHKLLLAAQSSYFNTMFTSPLQGSRQYQVSTG